MWCLPSDVKKYTCLCQHNVLLFPDFSHVITVATSHIHCFIQDELTQKNVWETEVRYSGPVLKKLYEHVNNMFCLAKQICIALMQSVLQTQNAYIRNTMVVQSLLFVLGCTKQSLGFALFYANLQKDRIQPQFRCFK